MKIIVGLGNPGREYQLTRHNIGWQVADKLINQQGGKFRNSQKFKSGICLLALDNQEVLVAKPQTFMNASGEAVKLLINFYQENRKNLWLIHDDLDLPLGMIKIVKNRGSAGHKGVESVINQLGYQDFVRLRIGIKVEQQVKDNKDYVLGKFAKEESQIMEKTMVKAQEIILFALHSGIEKAMNKYNQDKKNV